MLNLPLARLAPGLALLCLSFFCSGCLDVSEDIRVRSDLSGSYILKLSLPENLASFGDLVPGEKSAGDAERNFEELQSRLEQEPFVESATASSVVEGESRVYSLDIQARDMRKLGEFFNSEAEKGGSPHRLSFSLERLSLGTFHFSRELQFSAAAAGGLPGMGAPEANPCAEAPAAEAGSDGAAAGEAGDKPRDLKDKLFDKGRELLDKGVETGIARGKEAARGLGGLFGGMLGEALLADHYYTVTLHANGISNSVGTVLEDGKAVQWRIPMSELMNGSSAGRTLSADFKALGISGTYMILLALLAMFLFGGLIIGIAISLGRRRRKAGAGAGDASAG